MLLAAACAPTTHSGSAASSGSTTAPGEVPTPDHVLVVVFENKDAASVVGAPEAPYLTSLAAAGATFTDAHGVTHPSQPNYVALFAGSPLGVVDDSCPHSFEASNLAGQLLAAGRTFVGYSEDLPAAGDTSCRAGRYARKHNPWVDFPALPPEVNQPAGALPADFADLPTVAFLVPNLCNDMHDCGVPAGDAWAKAHLPAYVGWARTHDSLLVVTFDEDEGSRDNLIPTFMVGPMVKPGSTPQRIDHYSVLRTLEDMYGLPPLGEAASRQPISGIWTAG
nr:alkaline phosphatase family protein [Petropleomorpha daqingensis]